MEKTVKRVVIFPQNENEDFVRICTPAGGFTDTIVRKEGTFDSYTESDVFVAIDYSKNTGVSVLVSSALGSRKLDYRILDIIGSSFHYILSRVDAPMRNMVMVHVPEVLVLDKDGKATQGAYKVNAMLTSLYKAIEESI